MGCRKASHLSFLRSEPGIVGISQQQLHPVDDRPMLGSSCIMNRWSAKGHGVAEQMIIRDAESLANTWQQIVDSHLGKSIPDRADAIRLGKQLKV